jgi:hypothetical protein
MTGVVVENDTHDEPQPAIPSERVGVVQPRYDFHHDDVVVDANDRVSQRPTNRLTTATVYLGLTVIVRARVVVVTVNVVNLGCGWVIDEDSR